jgi:hypothetical protein
MDGQAPTFNIESKAKKLQPLCELMELLTKPFEKIDQSPLLSGLITMLAYADLHDLSRKWQPLKRLKARGQTRKAEARVKAQG